MATHTTPHPLAAHDRRPDPPPSATPGGRARPVPRWVTAAAFAVPLCVLPSAAWRIGHVVDAILNGIPCESGVGELVYIAGLSVISMTAALLTVGLVRPWGEVVPRWIPFAGGRPVPVRGATLAATTGATLIALVTAYAVLNNIFGWVEGPLKPPPPGCQPPGTAVLVAYIPLLAWAPLLYLVTYQYYRRRTRS